MFSAPFQSPLKQLSEHLHASGKQLGNCCESCITTKPVPVLLIWSAFDQGDSWASKQPQFAHRNALVLWNMWHPERGAVLMIIYCVQLVVFLFGLCSRTLYRLPWFPFHGFLSPSETYWLNTIILIEQCEHTNHVAVITAWSTHLLKKNTWPKAHTLVQPELRTFPLISCQQKSTVGHESM